MPKVIVALGIVILCVVGCTMFSWIGNVVSTVQQTVDRLQHITLPTLPSLLLAARHLPGWAWVAALVLIVLVLFSGRR